jgi:hypothetical protein
MGFCANYLTVILQDKGQIGKFKAVATVNSVEDSSLIVIVDQDLGFGAHIVKSKRHSSVAPFRSSPYLRSRLAQLCELIIVRCLGFLKDARDFLKGSSLETRIEILSPTSGVGSMGRRP